MNQSGFRFAITIEDYYAPRSFKNDERYVRWMFRLWGKKNEVPYAIDLDYHICTQDDFTQFYPIETRQEKLLNEIKNELR